MGASIVATKLHPSIAHAFQLAALTHCVGAAELEAAVERLFADVDTWDRSDLGRTGLPFELAFASADPQSLRITADVASPAMSLDERLQHAAAMYDELASTRMPDDVRFAVDRARPRVFGGYLGLRWPSVKLYVDTTDASDWPLPPFSSPVAARLSMAAYDGASDRIELYYRAEAMGIAGVMSLLGANADAVLDLLVEAVGRPLRGSLPSCDLGFSISAIRGRGARPRITLYGFAGSLFGSDRRCREAILGVSDAHGWRFPLYERASEPLRDARGPAMHHGMFGIVSSVDAAPSITFGLTPCEVPA